ncbi:MAG: MFS transporter [Gammaproteobacteria bacterium]|jgi:sugar phosphate permease|nr:MFS transporter [Gammaproteobacteria bacterium]
MTGKVPLTRTGASSLDTTPRSSFVINVLPWVICGLAAAFYCYEYLLRITPGLMVPELQRAFSINNQYLNATQVGHLSAFYYYAYTPMQLPVGLFMDRYGPRWILTMAVFCCAVGTVLFGATDSWWIAASGRFAIGFGSAFAFVGVLKLASNWLPPNRFAMISGLTTTLGMIGAMQGDIILGDLIQKIGWRDTILYSSYIGFILVPIIWLVVRNSPSHLKGASIQEQAKAACGSYSQLWQEIRFSMKNKQIWINGIIGGLLWTPTMVFPELWGKLYLQTIHQFSAEDAARAVTMILLGIAVGAPLAGYISDKIQRRRTPLIVGALLSTILLLIFLYCPNLSLLQVKLLLFFIGVVTSTEVICFAVGRENCPQNLSGTVVAVTNFLVSSFAICQVVVAKVLDYTWNGQLVDQAKIYSVDSYQTAMLILPVATLSACFLSFFLKETYCRPIGSPLDNQIK